MEAQIMVTTVGMARKWTWITFLLQVSLSGLNEHWYLAQNGQLINLINELMETKAQYG